MYKIAKITRKFISYTTRKVVDVDTRQEQIATYLLVLGFVVKTTYKNL